MLRTYLVVCALSMGLYYLVTAANVGSAIVAGVVWGVAVVEGYRWAVAFRTTGADG